MSSVLLRISRSSLASSRSRHPIYSSFLFSRTVSSLHFPASHHGMFAVPAAFAEEEAETFVFPREGLGVSYGLNWALAGRGVIVKDKAYYNLKLPELQKFSAGKTETLSGLTLHMRGNANGGNPEISKAQFGKLLKQVTSHISSVSSIFVQDGAVCSSPKCDAKVRVISDSPSALLPLADLLWKTPCRDVSHVSCPLTVYIASSIRENLGLGSQSATTFAAADIEHSSLILCGNAFADDKLMKDALSALSGPIILTKGGLPLSARIVVSGNSGIILFAHEDTITNSNDLHGTLLSVDAGAVLSSNGVSSFFRTKDPTVANVLKRPSAIIFAIADSTGALPSISKLSPGQAAYHFLAGYQDGKFIPAFIKSPSALDPLALAKAFHSQLMDNEIPSFLINVNEGGKHMNGIELIQFVKSSFSSGLPKSQVGANDAAKVSELKEKFKTFLSGRFEGLPEEFQF